MMIQNYSRLVERIASSSGKDVEEIERLVEAKRAKLSGLISREGAAQIIAAELGISFEKQKMKINELLDGMKTVNTIGKIITMFPVREYKKEKRGGKIGSFILADETGNVRTVLWDVNHIDLIEKGQIKEGDVVEITKGSMRNMELHLTGFSDIKLSPVEMKNVKTEMEFYESEIKDFKIGKSFKTRAIIVQVFEPRFFQVCPECGKKVVNGAEGYKCEKHGKVVPQRKVLISLILDDGSESIRSVLFSEQIEKLGLKMEDLEDENFVKTRENLLGKEAYFSGSVRQNKLFNNQEFFVSDIQEIEIEKLIEVLEHKEDKQEGG